MTTQKAIRIHKAGDFDVVQFDTDVPVPEISETQVLVKNSYAGINFIENYFRIGLYPAKYPLILGREGAGEVVKVGSKVTNFAIGDKVGYLSVDSYAEFTAVESNGMITKLSKSISEETAAASLVQGLTALTFLREAHKVERGDYVLIYAAAGGAGSIFVQLAHRIGAHVIGVVSTEKKAEIAKNFGAEFVINRKTEDIAKRVHEITKGAGVIAVFDSIGAATFDTSLECIARKGTFVSFGNASGPVPPVKLLTLTPKNIKICRPTVLHYVQTPEEWNSYTNELFGLISEGHIKIEISKVYPLSDVRKALEDLSSAETTGKLLVKI